ncbi:MAG: hypothetical protein C0467_07075 [Planctomycetaceae bacterium]|nr:hypothetical protein [Planctomycetaceae bacterium]
MWSELATSTPSFWTSQAMRLTPSARASRQTTPSSANHTTKGTTTQARKPATTSSELLTGVVLNFDTLSCEQTLPRALAKIAGFDISQIMIAPGAFDKSLKRCRAGRVNGNVRFQFDHNDRTKTCSTISGALRLLADSRSLYFIVGDASRDGAKSVREAKRRTECREVSAGFYAHKFHVIPGEPGEANVIYVAEAELFEVSLVELGAFPRTSVEFI